MFFGLASEHRAGELACAVMEGVAFGVAEADAAQRLAGPTLADASINGGGPSSTI
ncbi:hypothetical protein [Burkholderia pseudomallei]|uniref:hypothetical protein n=1 Tax=Burkholderia pseudomallei TaxID=28450 RepID=UPI00215636F1